MNARLHAAALGVTCILLCRCTPSSHERAADATPTIAPSASQAAPDWASAVNADAAQPQAISLLGQPLYPPPLPAEVLSRRQEQLYLAQAEYDRDLHDETAIIWLGRRQAYLGQYREAIDTFSNGLAILPESYRLLRHRGHRFITVREFDKAIADLTRAAELVQELDDEVEPDGQPNALNIPTSTTNTNIYYHLGLAHYLKGDWREAAAAYQTCIDLAANDDMRVAATYWLYLSLMRVGDTAGAKLLLTTIDPDMEIIENTSYLQLLLVYQGSLDSRALRPAPGAANDATIDIATIGYGLGMRDVFAGRSAEAERQFREVLADSNWAAFGHIAAEAELARSARASSPAER